MSLCQGCCRTDSYIVRQAGSHSVMFLIAAKNHSVSSFYRTCIIRCYLFIIVYVTCQFWARISLGDPGFNFVVIVSQSPKCWHLSGGSPHSISILYFNIRNGSGICRLKSAVLGFEIL